MRKIEFKHPIENNNMPASVFRRIWDRIWIYSFVNQDLANHLRLGFVVCPVCIVLCCFSLLSGIVLGVTYLATLYLIQNSEDILQSVSSRIGLKSSPALSYEKKTMSPRRITPKVCRVCNSPVCSRDSGKNCSSKHFPWKESFIPGDVNTALEEFFNMTLDHHVIHWYKSVNLQEDFLIELKLGLRFIIANIWNRLRNVDLSDLILDKLVPAGIQHFNQYLRIKRLAETNLDRKSAVVTELDLKCMMTHVALRTRNSELEYLQKMTAQGLRVVLPPKHHNCRALFVFLRDIVSGSIALPLADLVADPDTINQLVLLLFDEPLPIPRSNEDKTEILSTFVSSHSLPVPPPVLLKPGLELRMVLRNPKLLFYFMKFLTREDSLNVLQFCLTIEDFNSKILNPDLTLEQLKALHEAAKQFYELFLDPNSPDFINVDVAVSDGIKTIVSDENPANIVLLRTTEPLYQAFDFAFTLLERNFLPLFFQSGEFYALVFGERNMTKKQQSRFRQRLQSGLATLGLKINDKLKGVFKSTAIDGSLFQGGSQEDIMDAEFADEFCDRLDDDDDMEEDSLSTDDVSSVRDLSPWRVCIPRIESKLDETNRPALFFIIDVQRIETQFDSGRTDMHYVVGRRYNEFYVLESKLVEFHGELIDVRLPEKRVFGTKNADFLKTVRPAFEEFIQRLLQKSYLRGSELMFRFLTSADDFTTSLLPDINLGKMIKNVPMILMKEKGQHLDSFLTSFVSSTEQQKQKFQKCEYDDGSCRNRSALWKQLHNNDLFEDNIASIDDLSFEDDIQANGSFIPNGKTSISITCFVDVVFYLALELFNVSQFILHCLAALKMMFGEFVNNWTRTYLAGSLRTSLEPQRVTYLIHFIRDVLYKCDDPEAEREKYLKDETARDVEQRLKSIIPKLLVSVLIGDANYEQSIESILDCFQRHPRLNKQLSYVLLDILFEELFPEFREEYEVPEKSPFQ